MASFGVLRNLSRDNTHYQTAKNAARQSAANVTRSCPRRAPPGRDPASLAREHFDNVYEADGRAHPLLTRSRNHERAPTISADRASASPHRPPTHPSSPAEANLTSRAHTASDAKDTVSTAATQVSPLENPGVVRSSRARPSALLVLARRGDVGVLDLLVLAFRLRVRLALLS